uniref:RNA-directed DNA polymerase homolog n=1 Tax=Nicotiana tabacum TaxID=4097 RepID=A0A1S4CY67_TOBAC|nr:PREDICTED: RNA-directed DNA polymerase homolog [Nicotiana tabacum]
MTVITNDNSELIPTKTVTGWRVCMDYRKLNKVTWKDHFLLPFLDQMLDRLDGRAYYCFLDGHSGYNQILIAPKDQEKTTFTCSYGTFAFSRMLFGLCNAPATFRRCMMAIFTDMVEDFLKVFMNDFSDVGDSFEEFLDNLDKVFCVRVHSLAVRGEFRGRAQYFVDCGQMLEVVLHQVTKCGPQENFAAAFR